MPPRQLLRQRFRERPDILLHRTAHDRDVDVDAFRARRLGISRHAQRGQGLVHNARGLEDLIPAGGAGIQVEVQVIWPIDIIAFRIPLIEIDASEIDHPEQGGEIVNDRKVDDVARVVLDPASANPVGARHWRTLHEKELSTGAVRIPLHDHRAIADVRQEHRGDVRVVLNQIAFRDAEVRPEQLVEVGQPDFAAFDRQDGMAGGWNRDTPGHTRL